MIDFENMSLKEKCYAYQHEANYFLDENKYIIAHIDGRSFSTMVKNKFKRPFDPVFIDAMNRTAVYLCGNVAGCVFAYVQSDEITLIIRKNSEKSNVFFNARVCKMQSIIASLATCKFNQIMMLNSLSKIPACASSHDILKMVRDCIDNHPLYQFDCKVWNVDTPNDAMAWVLFRNIDCVRNSKQQTVQTYISHNRLQHMNTDDQIALLKEEKSIDWNLFEDGMKYGRFIKKVDKSFEYNGITFLRHVWEPVSGCDLTNQDNRNNLANELNIIDIYGNDSGQENI